MPKSNFAKNLDALQAHVTAFLKPLGFRKKGRTYNRTTEDGLVQAVNFQMGAFPIGDYVIPGIRESFYGKFAVNLGVLLPCVYETEQQKPVPDFTQEHYCSIRRRLGTLAFGSDHWFELTSDIPTLATTVVQLFDRFGLPFVEQFPNYASVLAYYDAHGDLPSQTSGRASLEAAIVAHYLGDARRTHQLLAKAHTTDHEGFCQYVSTIANRLGYQIA
jgi:hypothetical protein